MKDSAYCSIIKPFSGEVNGCSRDFTNDDHPMINMERNDILNIEFKNMTFSDQTPTPTQFIKNCEEVGLFQDLQNVNPFEETFKKAAEAVQTGQPIALEKSQPDLLDDTLHTPNIFPLITDMPVIPQDLKSDDIQSADESSMINEINYATTTDGNANVHMNQNIIGTTENVQSRINSSNENVIFNVPDDYLVQFFVPDSVQNYLNMVLVKSTGVFDSTMSINLKEKLKKSLSDRISNNKIFPQKIPIPKCPNIKVINSENQFSKYGLLSKLKTLEKEKCSLKVDSGKKQKPKNYKFDSRESRDEFLARSRAASFRCREKKKKYLLYLEKLNTELLSTNQRLQLINFYLGQQIGKLHAELLKHRYCNVADKNTEIALTTILNVIEENFILEEKNEQGGQKSPLGKVENETQSGSNAVPGFLKFTPIETKRSLCEEVMDPISFTFDVAEETIHNDVEDNQIPLEECNKAQGIIVKFNDQGNAFSAKFAPDSCLESYLKHAKEDVKRLYAEHCYFTKNPISDLEDRFTNCPAPKDSLFLAECPGKGDDSIETTFNNNGILRSLTDLDARSLLQRRTPPPLILLKPFKKRTRGNNLCENT